MSAALSSRTPPSLNVEIPYTVDDLACIDPDQAATLDAVVKASQAALEAMDLRFCVYDPVSRTDVPLLPGGEDLVVGR